MATRLLSGRRSCDSGWRNNRQLGRKRFVTSSSKRMPVCHQCGAQAGNEKFCGVCGSRLPRETVAAASGDSLVPPPGTSSSPPSEPNREERPTSMAAQRGTGELVEEG